ncbi:hypothetical protein [Streptococcus suis]|uniref:Uncharacterized protein n=2 Tax=Streptococcus suis TaxID=1307 RepID=A0AA87K343_STRSU|nr:hypothetical protein [Streptococcus suis]AUC91921.1 hypothetical protein CWM22_08455 [Streptococcus suis]EHC02039.1 hypothetical protein SSUR61_2231 [Streptococcus suis R61]MBY5000881.1 hypothetical protein [Streptococcus suis]MBY5011803.1 hypothetical protein [Streptococcus suis]MBY5018668.1 hypothetical protein [Streptococcus suis]
MVYQFYPDTEYSDEVNGTVLSQVLNSFVTKYSRELSKIYHEKSEDYNRPETKIGLDRDNFYTELCAFIPDIQPMRRGTKIEFDLFIQYPISMLADSVMFLFQNLSDIEEIGTDFYSKECYKFVGGTVKRNEFVAEVNQLLERNHLNYYLDNNGTFSRKVSDDFNELLDLPVPAVEAGIDNLIQDSKKLICSYEEGNRKLGLEKIIDAFQRTKSLYAQNQDEIRASVTKLQENVSEGHVKFQSFVDSIMTSITSIANNAEIRHTEVYQDALQSEKQRDYLFQVTLLTINLLLTGYNETEVANETSI